MNLSIADLDPDVARRLADNPRFARLHAANASAVALWGPDANQMPLQQKAVIVTPSVLGGLCLAYLFVSGQVRLATIFASVVAVVFFLSLAYLAMYWRHLKNRLKRLGVNSIVVPAVNLMHSDASRPNTPLALADLRDASRFLFGLPRSEQVYLNAVVALWEAAENETLPETEARDLLRHLLESDRALEAQEARLARLGGDAETARLANERDALAVRADQAADPAARDALAQSVVLCDARLVQAREVAPLRERASAQREVLAQTLASLHDAVLRLGVAPAAAGIALGGEMDRARDAASRIAAQSRAMEAAVQEVMAIGTGR